MPKVQQRDRTSLFGRPNSSSSEAQPTVFTAYRTVSSSSSSSSSSVSSSSDTTASSYSSSSTTTLNYSDSSTLYCAFPSQAQHHHPHCPPSFPLPLRRLPRPIVRTRKAIITALESSCVILLNNKSRVDTELENSSLKRKGNSDGQNERTKSDKVIVLGDSRKHGRGRHQLKKSAKNMNPMSLTPWAKLIRCLQELTSSPAIETDQGPIRVLHRFIALLHNLVQTDKTYSKSLSRDEARCLPVFLKLVRSNPRWKSSTSNTTSTTERAEFGVDTVEEERNNDHSNEEAAGDELNFDIDLDVFSIPDVVDQEKETIDFSSTHVLVWIPRLLSFAMGLDKGQDQEPKPSVFLHRHPQQRRRRRVKLDLSYLDLEAAQFIFPLLRIFGAPQVECLDLSFATLTEWPWTSLDLPRLRSLRISNSALESLPYHVLAQLEEFQSKHCPATRVSSQVKQKLISLTRFQSTANRSHIPQTGPLSLVQLCLTTLRRSGMPVGPYQPGTHSSSRRVLGEQLGLPSHLATAVDMTYECDRCHRIAYPPEVGGDAPGKVSFCREVEKDKILVNISAWLCRACVNLEVII